MPIYEYKCESCTDTSEIIQKISDPTPKECPKCGKGPLHKMMSMSSFHLKGGGWFKDSFPNEKSDKKSEGAASEDSKSASSEKSSEKTTKSENSQPSSDKKTSTAKDKD